MRLHYAGFQPGASGFGWATCNASLVRELGKRVELCGPDNADVVFMPLADHDFSPVSEARAVFNVAYTFFEYPLGPNAAENARKYDIVFCGSTWCLDRMKERGITNGEVLIQGVDHSIFKPGPREKGNQFRIFSGGKFEYRKGQDLVIAAFKEFAKTHPEAHLVCSWFNPWPQLITQSLSSMDVASDLYIPLPWNIPFNSQEELFSQLLAINGLRRDQFTILPQLSQQKLAQAMQNTDCGLFPNRCEGGTNLVLMEYLACGKWAVANRLTGHADLINSAIIPTKAVEDENHWAAQDVKDIVIGIEAARRRTQDPGPLFPQWTWERAANQILDSIEALTPA